jgi:hypothetical protein
MFKIEIGAVPRKKAFGSIWLPIIGKNSLTDHPEKCPCDWTLEKVGYHVTRLCCREKGGLFLGNSTSSILHLTSFSMYQMRSNLSRQINLEHANGVSIYDYYFILFFLSPPIFYTIPVVFVYDGANTLYKTALVFFKLFYFFYSR